MSSFRFHVALAAAKLSKGLIQERYAYTWSYRPEDMSGFPGTGAQGTAYDMCHRNKW